MVNDYLQVDNSAMTYMLINAVKEQQQNIEQQNAIAESQSSEIEVLKSELASLKKIVSGLIGSTQKTADSK